MLQQRILTAIILVLCLIAVAFYAGDLVFFLFISLLSLIGAWEWSKLAGFNKPLVRALFCLCFTVCFALAYVALSDLLLPLLLVSLICWLFFAACVLIYPAYTSSWNNQFFLFLAGILVIFPCWFGLLNLRNNDHFTLVFLGLFLMVAAADSGAYFAGKRFGKNKLAPHVSPNKTWEGVLGGLVSCVLISCGYFFIYDRIYGFNFSWINLVATSVLVTVFSITGDLFESMLKRARDLKDSGNILPGHGGLLDRIDGLVAATPVYMLMMTYFV